MKVIEKSTDQYSCVEITQETGRNTMNFYLKIPDYLIDRYIYENPDKFTNCLAEACNTDELFDIVDNRLKERLSSLIELSLKSDNLEISELAKQLACELKISFLSNYLTSVK